MKTKLRKYGLIVCMTACLVLCSVLGSAFMTDTAEASADGIATYSDVTVEADTFEEGVTYETADGILFEYKKSYGGYVVTGLSEGVTEVVIPDAITLVSGGEEHTYSVVRIGTSAFEKNTDITSVSTGDGVKIIESYAFSHCTSLTSVTFGSSVTGLNTEAFYQCTALESICFNAASMSDLSENNKVFYNAGTSGSGITVTVGAGVTKIPAYLFNPDGTVINYVPNITTVAFEDGSLCETIGSYAFFDCRYLTTVTIPEGVKTIGEYAFNDCILLKTVYFNAASMSDTAWKDRVFERAGTSGSGITVTVGAGVTRIPAYLFAKYTGTSGYYAKVTTLKFASGSVCKEIGEYAFYKCTDLKSVSLPSSLTSIGVYAFYECESLTTVTIPDSVTAIEKYTFYKCTALTSVVIGSSVTKIGGYSFHSCSKLTSVTIPKSVTTINSYAFCKCSKLTAAVFIDTEGWYCSKCTFSSSTLANSGTAATYLTSTYYSYAWYKEVTEEFEYALSSDGTYYILTKFNNDKGEYTDVVIENEYDFVPVKEIASSVFEGHTEITSITIPGNIVTIGNYAFYGCTFVTKINFNATAMNDLDMGNCVFYSAGSNTSGITVTVGANVTRIPGYLFCPNNSASCCPYVTTVVFESGSRCTEISDRAFSYCGKLTDITLPEGVVSIRPFAFSTCSALTTFVIPSTVTTIYHNAFGADTALTSITIPQSVTSIGDQAFYNCKGLTEINYYAPQIADLWAENYMFAYAGQSSGGITVTIGASVERVPANLFYPTADKICMPNITAVVFESGGKCTEIGEGAFCGLDGLSALYVDDLASYLSIDFGDAYANPLAVVSANGGTFCLNGDVATRLSQSDMSGVTRMGTYALAGCTLITSVGFGDALNSIGAYAFYGNTSISSIAIPSSVTYMGEYAFSGTLLTAVSFASNSGWTVTGEGTVVKLAADDLLANSLDFLTRAYVSYVWERTVTSHGAPAVESKTENGGYTNSAISITTTVDGTSSIWYIAYTDPEGNTYLVYDHSLTISSGLVNGTYVFVATDADGLESDPYYIVYDDVAPDLYVGGIAAWVNYSDREFSVMALDDCPVTLYSSRDGKAWTLCADNPYTVYPEETYGTDGEYWFVAVDAAGNVTGPYYTVLDTVPVSGEWETGDDLYPYFYYEAPSYTTWTCTMNGEPYASGTKLKNCGATYYVTLVGKNGSTYTTDYTMSHCYPESGVYTAPTCSSYGYTTYSCVFCGDSYIVVDLYSESASHNYEKRQIDPTCTDKGSYWYVCTECGDSTTPVDIDALGHDPVADQMVAATCTTDGYTGKICSRCGVLLEGEITPATGHSYLTVSYSATCKELAKTVYTCSVCGDTFEVTTGIYYADHVWGEWEHESPTCTTEGYERRQCEVCGEIEEYVLKATGHSYTSAVWHEWTDEETGKIYRYRYCDVCGDVVWYDADDPTEVASNGVIDLFEKYQKYMWWIFLAFVGVWSIVIGLRWALQRSDQERVKTRSMLANYIIGLFVIAIILVGLPYLIYGIALLV